MNSTSLKLFDAHMYPAFAIWPLVAFWGIRGSCPSVCYVDTPQNTVIQTFTILKTSFILSVIAPWHQTLLHITHRLARKDTAPAAFMSVCFRRRYVNENVSSWEKPTTMACMLNRVYRYVSFQLWILFRRGSDCMIWATVCLKHVGSRQGEQTPGITSPGFYFILRLLSIPVGP